jgi:hypothetical protein
MTNLSFQLQGRRASVQLLCDAIANCAPSDAAQILSAALEGFETDGPMVSLDDLRSDAKFWADCASPRELEVYLWANLRVLGQRAFASTARKRIFVSLWDSFADDDRTAFLSRVDPHG